MDLRSEGIWVHLEKLPVRLESEGDDEGREEIMDVLRKRPTTRGGGEKAKGEGEEGGE